MTPKFFPLPLEVPPADLETLWLRGGFPDSFLAANDRVGLRWRQDFIRTYLERDIPQLGPRIPAETLRRFWMMPAHHQSGLLNAAELARSLGVDGKTVASYLDLLVDLLLVRRLEPWHANVGKPWSSRPRSMSATVASRMPCSVSKGPNSCLAIRLPAPAGKPLRSKP